MGLHRTRCRDALQRLAQRKGRAGKHRYHPGLCTASGDTGHTPGSGPQGRTARLADRRPIRLAAKAACAAGYQKTPYRLHPSEKPIFFSSKLLRPRPEAFNHSHRVRFAPDRRLRVRLWL
jgi:hypothetical protein